MNNQLIEKVIKSNDSKFCSEFTYENPLLDRNVAGALARSFVKILRVSQPDSNININLRHSVLANIRKICRVEPENHFALDENFTSSLTEVYINKIIETHNDSGNNIERRLDEFLLRRMKEMDLNSNYQSSMNPEVIQALLHLNENSFKLLTNNILHWNVNDKKSQVLVKELWTNTTFTDSLASNICDISIKFKSEIEKIFLNLCYSILTDPKIQIKELLHTNTVQDLVNKCSKSTECFQICTRILNHVFIDTSYNTDILNFVSKFIDIVKQNSNSFSILYPTHLRSIVVLLDIDLDVLPQNIQNDYEKQTIAYLKTLQEKTNTDIVMLLSHFPIWFDIFEKHFQIEVKCVV